ncbi:SLC13 family permease [Sphingosinicella rhizophila]|uniref:SLC13 family permease n=1 Tax=Sphingosinicella rhizophila TaxID=3050082 RepID=A0ABU3Q6R8_9SPHN|nr:SLC13 family permease [Sphingosinicella sp. GR2756]MDT9599103.1 SLC13 family permease [Sphingosinicella sp. GR2756]
MTPDQLVTLLVLAAVVAALIWDKVRADVAALAGAAVLLASGVVRPSEAQSAFASPALIALASLFVIVYAIELSGLLDRLIALAVRLGQRLGALGLWITIALCGAASAFLNNTPIVVLSAPVIRDSAEKLGLNPKRFLMPLSYMCILGGCCTLIGTSTNLLVSDMARVSGQPVFGLFEITPVGLAIAAAGALYLLLASGRLIEADESQAAAPGALGRMDMSGAQVGAPEVFTPHQRLDTKRAALSLFVFASVIAVAALGIAPIAASAFAGAVLLILLRVISADEAYQGLRPEILLLIAGMVVLGIALEESGLAGYASDALVRVSKPLGPVLTLALFYGATLFLTEVLSNATVAVLFAPVAVALAESLGVSPRPFLVAVMMAASAAFATPFGYQTNVLVYQIGKYSYMDFVRVGLPLNLITWAVGLVAIVYVFPL